MLSEGLRREGSEHDEAGFVYLHVFVFRILVADEAPHGLNDVKTVLTRHLKVQKHQVDRGDLSLFSNVFESIFDQVCAHVDCLLAVVAEGAAGCHAELLYLSFDNFQYDRLVFSDNDIAF